MEGCDKRLFYGSSALEDQDVFFCIGAALAGVALALLGLELSSAAQAAHGGVGLVVGLDGLSGLFQL